MTSIRIPNELWLQIFRCATTSDDLSQLLTTEFAPFHHFSGLDPNPHSVDQKEVRSTLAALALTSRTWRALSLPFFYEILNLCHSSYHGLVETFERSEVDSNGHGYGRYVRRLVLSALDPKTPLPEDALTRIMQLCPNAKLLVKRDDDITPLPLSNGLIDALSPVTRFDWWFTRCREIEDLAFVDFNLDQGLDCFRTIVQNARNLEYISIGIRYSTSRHSLCPPRALTLENVTTLRLRSTGFALRKEIEGWQFPKLTHLITDASLLWNEYSSLFTPNLKVVEFLCDEIMVELYPLAILECCPSLREMYYHIEFARFPENVKQHFSLERIGLHAGLNFMLRSSDGGGDSGNGFDIWKYYEHHFKMLASSYFPSLQNVVLYGDWSAVTGDEVQFRSMIDSLEGDFRQKLVYPGGSRVFTS